MTSHVEQILSIARELLPPDGRRRNVNSHQQQITDVPRRLISVTDFVQKIMGKAHRSWYTRHQKDPGMPQKLYGPPGTNPMLDYDECIAFAKSFKAQQR